MYRMAAGCHSLAVVSGSDGSACRVALIWERLAKTVNPPQNTFFKHPVEIWGVLLYYKENVLGRKHQMRNWLSEEEQYQEHLNIE